MKLGIIGLAGAGKTTLFEALTRNISDIPNKTENRIAAIHVPDERVDILSRMYKPKKTIYAQIEYFLPGIQTQEKKKDQNILTPIRDCDALICTIRNFSSYGLDAPKPYEDFLKMDQELIFSDLLVTEKRLERIELDKKRGKPLDNEELSLLIECKKHLEQDIPLRRFPDIAKAPALRGFAFLSAKPMMILFNNADDDDALPDVGNLLDNEIGMVIRGKLEREIAQMSEEDAKEFLSEFHITESATDRVIRKSYEVLGLMSFFTVGDDEVRAWTIRKNTPAIDAAEVIHSDIKKGFIRAEILAYHDLMAAGNYAEARKKGTVRLEGKTYLFQDGDIVNFRFNV